MEKWEIFNDNFQNYKSRHLPKAQFVIADIPYNLGVNAYASSRQWYKDGGLVDGFSDGSSKEHYSDKAGKQFFATDKNFNLAEFFHFCHNLIIKEPKEPNKAGCMLVFCAFEQQFRLIELAKKHGFKHYINLVFRKKSSAQVLKANMRIVGNCEYGLLFYRDKLPKFRNNGKMIMNCFDWDNDSKIARIHPTQKPIKLLERLIALFTDPNDVVIDPCCGSGSTIIAARNLGRRAYGFEINKEFASKAKEWLDASYEPDLFVTMDELDKKAEIEKHKNK